MGALSVYRSLDDAYLGRHSYPDPRNHTTVQSKENWGIIIEEFTTKVTRIEESDSRRRGTGAGPEEYLYDNYCK